MVPELQNIGSKNSMQLFLVLNGYVLIVLSIAAAAIPTIKPSATRRSNAVSVDAIKAYEEVEGEPHAFLISGIHGDKWLFEPGRFISDRP
jgi:hypothetical protein